MFWFVSSLLVLATIWFFFIKPHSYWKNKGVKQSKPWPFLGDSWRMTIGKTCFLNYVNWIYEQGKGLRYFGFYQFNKPVLVVMDPELIKQITVKEFDSFSHHNFLSVDAETDPYWGKNVLVLKGQEWKNMRSTLSPSYTASKMRVNYELMAETSETFVNYFLGKNQDLIEVEMKDAFARFTNDVIAITAFGLKVDSLKDQDNTFYYHGSGITNVQSFSSGLKVLLLQLSPITFKIFGLQLLPKEHTKYFHEVLFETLRQRQEQNIVRPDLINILLESRKEREKNISNGRQVKSMSDEDILAQALIFFFGGFETISSTLSWLAYELALNKEVQDKLRQEIKETYSKHKKPSFDVIQEMKYLDMVISEILRKWPTFMMFDRVVSKPFTIEPVNKNEVPVHLEVGTSIFVPVYRLQTEPNYFPNPHNFDPERFSEENKHKIKPYTYLPFGAGPRTCMGNRFASLEIKSLIFNILLNFEIVPIKRTPIPPKVVMPSFQYTMEGGFWLGLKRIKV